MLLCALLLSSAVGCASGTTEDIEESKQQAGTPANAEETETEFDPSDTSVDGRTHYSDIIEGTDLDGWTMNIAHNRDDAGYTFIAEEISGETLNDLVYERNERIKTKFNIDIQQTGTDGSTTLKSTVNAGLTDVSFAYMLSSTKRIFGTFKSPTHPLSIGTLQHFIDGYLESDMNAKCDYIHGEDAVIKLSQAENCVGFLVNGIEKKELFPYVERYGPLPKKTFSMGEADSKRYYLEMRKITE